jgi:hypothetical protein
MPIRAPYGSSGDNPRRILASEWLSADGYFTGSDGNLSWIGSR